MGTPLRVLIVADSAEDTQWVLRELRKGGWAPEFERVETPEAMRAALEGQRWDVVLCEYALPRFSALAALSLLNEVRADIPFLVVSGQIGEDTAVQMMRAGAHDYVMKNNLARLVPAVERELQEARVRRERRRAEAALRESEMRYRELTESITDVFFVMDEYLMVTYWNHAAEDLTGISAANAVGQSLYDIFPDAAATVAEQAYLDVLRTRQGQSFLTEYHLGGEGQFYEVSVSPFRDGVSVFAKDITGRRLAEEVLAHERYLLNMLMDNTPDHIYFKDANARFIRVSRALADHLGLGDPSEAVGKTDADFFDPDRATQALADEREVMETGRALVGKEERQTWPDGRVTWGSTTKVPLCDAEGQIVGTFGISRDTTVRKLAECALRESEEKYRSIFETAANLITCVDANGIVVDCNSRLGQVLGYDREEIIGESMARVIHPDDSPGVRDALREVMAGGSAKWQECRIVRKDGGVIDVTMNSSALTDSDGQFLRTICVVEDITERKNLEEQLRQAQKLEAVGQLAGGIAHDFRNQLTVIKGYGEMVLRRLCVNDEGREHVGEILEAVRQSEMLTGQLLAFSRKEAVCAEVVDLNRVIDSMSKSLARMIGDDIELSILHGDDECNVKVDPVQFQQALFNLAVNARDAMPHGGQLTIETDNVELDPHFVAQHVGASPGPHVMVAVSDVGTGMDPETVRRVFEPFFTTKPGGGGTGLGLAMVYGFVKQSGGHITVESVPGRGSTFRAYLPRVVEPPARAEPAPARLALPRGRGTVLVVEDEEAIRQVLVQTLRECGYAVLASADASGALATAARHDGRIDLLITDVVMPGMNGPDLAVRIRAARPDVKALYVSGYDGHALRERGIIEDHVDLLTKPFTAQSLTQEVRRILRDRERPPRWPRPRKPRPHTSPGPRAPRA